LWRNAGVNINQILPRSRSSTQHPAGTAATALNASCIARQRRPYPDGILLSRIRTTLNRADFAASLPAPQVETPTGICTRPMGAYSVEEVMRLAHQLCSHPAAAVAGTVAFKIDLPQIREVQEFRGERLKALGNVIEAERTCAASSLSVEDGHAPSCRSRPRRCPSPRLNAALCDAFTHRPS